LLFKRLPLRPQQEAEAFRIVDLIRDQLIPLTGKHAANLEIKGLKDRRTQWLKTIRSVEATEVSRPLLKTLEQAFKAIDYEAYDKAWKRLAQVLELKPTFDEGERILAQLAQAAPQWAEAIRHRESPHEGGTPPGNLERAWTHRQLAQKLASLGGPDVEKLEERLGLVTQKLQKVNGLYVEKLSWRAQVERTGLKQPQALDRWRGLYRKSGQGTGRHAGKF